MAKVVHLKQRQPPEPDIELMATEASNAGVLYREGCSQAAEGMSKVIAGITQYGYALLGARGLINSDRLFGQWIKDNKLDAEPPGESKQSRHAAMQIAGISTVSPRADGSFEGCTHTSPMRIMKWYRKRHPEPKQDKQTAASKPPKHAKPVPVLAEPHVEPESPQPEPPMAEVKQPTAPPQLQEEAVSVQPAKPDTDQAVVADLKARLAEEQRTASLARFAIARLESPDPDAEHDPAAFLAKRKRALKDWDLARLQCAVDVSREKTIAQLREQVGTREDRHTFERQLAALVEWLADVTQDISEEELAILREPYARPKPAPASTALPEPIGSAEPLPDYILTGRLYDFSDMEVPTKPKAKRTRAKR